MQGLDATRAGQGTGLRPEITFASTPQLPQDELLSRILFGTSITNLSAPEALQLASAVAALQSGSGSLDPINALRRAVGLDRLRIVPADVATGQRTSIAAGKYITRKLFVEVVTDGQGYSATRVEYQMTRWLSLLSTVSTIGRTSASVRVSKDYKSSLRGRSTRHSSCTAVAARRNDETGERMKNWNVRKTVIAREDMPEEHRLKQSLGWPHLVALGVGAIVGTGILTLIGVGAGKAGPAVILSFAIAGLICACAALAYAEVATMIPASGSAYTYSYVVFGELIAWMIGVALVLEYTLVVSAVAVGWSGYASGFLNSVGLGLPDALVQGTGAGRHHQPARDFHHLGGRRAADRRHARKRDAQRHPGGHQDCRAGAVHRRRAAGVQRRQFRPVHALRVPAQRPVRAARSG